LITAPTYLLRVVRSGGPPGAMAPVHTHPGSETFHILSGKLTQMTPVGVMSISSGVYPNADWEALAFNNMPQDLLGVGCLNTIWINPKMEENSDGYTSLMDWQRAGSGSALAESTKLGPVRGARVRGYGYHR
jgi:hypothetical protein